MIHYLDLIRALFASGESSSSAGLTASAERDELGGWTLKAGALVLASGGIVLIDEFDKVERNNQLMNLHLLDFNTNAKLKIQAFMNEDPPKLNKMGLLLRFSKDGLSHAFHNFPDWISKTFLNVRG